MSVETRSEETIFCEALECPTLEARAAYLERVCDADPDLRVRLLVLLQAREDRPGFLAEAAVVLPARDLETVVAPEERAGQVIGSYFYTAPLWVAGRIPVGGVRMMFGTKHKATGVGCRDNRTGGLLRSRAPCCAILFE